MNSFDELCQDNYDRIYKYIYLRLKNKERTEDAVQNVFMIAYEKGKAFTKHPNPSGFLYVTAQNIVYESLREMKKQETEVIEEKVLGKFSDLQQELEYHEDEQINEEDYIEQVLECLSLEKRQLYEEYYIKHNSLEEIAKKYKISQVTLRMRYVRLRKEMKKIIHQVIAEV